jgi:hypothetical protein
MHPCTCCQEIPPRQFLSQSLVAAVFVATILLGAVSEPAQAQGPGDRSSFTGFFYVSSIRGDDALAANLNPGGSGKSKKMLMHAPGSATPIGVAIVDDKEEHPATPVIVNNTFAENRISIWSGSSLTGGSTGWAHPRILNNVIDSYCARTGASLSCFEGVFADDLVVGGASNWRTYNAWDGPFSSGAIYGRANLGATIAGWPVTATRTSSIGSGFGPLSAGGTNPYSADANGLGDAGGLDIAPDSAWHGLRVNCQIPQGASWSNLQTLLTVNGTEPAASRSSSGSSTVVPPPLPKLTPWPKSVTNPLNSGAK